MSIIIATSIRKINTLNLFIIWCLWKLSGRMCLTNIIINEFKIYLSDGSIITITISVVAIIMINFRRFVLIIDWMSIYGRDVHFGSFRSLIKGCSIKNN